MISSGAILAGGVAGAPLAGQRPAVTDPRATDGDDRYQPSWEQQLEITVGNSQGDLIGNDDRVLQAAIDYIGRRGGGTVRINPGTYTLRNAVAVHSKTRVVGSGSDSVITRIPSQLVPLAADSDWYDQEITLTGSGDFRVGDGVAIRAKHPDTGAATVIKRTIVARSGPRLKLNDGLRDNVWLAGDPHCASLFPLFTSERTNNVTIETSRSTATVPTRLTSTATMEAAFSGKIAATIPFAMLRLEITTGTGSAFKSATM